MWGDSNIMGKPTPWPLRWSLCFKGVWEARKTHQVANFKLIMIDYYYIFRLNLLKCLKKVWKSYIMIHFWRSMTCPRLCLCRFHRSSHAPHVLHKHWRPPAPLTFRTEDGQHLQQHPRFARKYPPQLWNTKGNSSNIQVEPNDFQSKISVTLDVFLGTKIFQIFFFGHKKTHPSEPPLGSKKTAVAPAASQ